jgi:hypothetical protein
MASGQMVLTIVPDADLADNLGRIRRYQLPFFTGAATGKRGSSRPSMGRGT